MILSKVANDSIVPDWMDEIGDLSLDSQSSGNSLSVVNVDEVIIASECEKIEQCSSQGQSYACPCNWPPDVIQHLKEYASVCKVRMVLGGAQKPVIQASMEPKMTKTANYESQTSRSFNSAVDDITAKLSAVMGDPFHIVERTDMSHMQPAIWEDVKPESKLSEKPNMKSLSITTLRGGENYHKHRKGDVAIGQNSIVAPDAIENLHNSDYQTEGEKLADSNQQRRLSREEAKAEWEREKIEAMPGHEILPRGKVFPTEVLNANTGIKPTVFREPDSMPELTVGEQLRGINAQRRESIQRPKSEDRSWEQPSRAATTSISDVFAESLQKHLGKNTGE